uniref:Reverse transcriptase domain-containing protein n=1 Tax=Tanacetum cinerariifolium TaxID=118510 RepID=A0A6L2KLJ0_TANCI|nr:hypothetical protein [Tanacetum cinerariifolium]
MTEFEKKDQAGKEKYINIIKKSVKEIIKDEVKSQLPQILPNEIFDFATHVIQSTINESLKNIMLDKLEKSKSYRAAEQHRDLYDALVRSYQLNKDLFDSYGKMYSLKRGHEDKDEDPSAGSDQGLKKGKTSNDVEPPRGSKFKESKSSSFKGSKSQSKSSGKSAQAEELVFGTADIEMPQDQGDDIGNIEDEPNVKEASKKNWKFNRYSFFETPKVLLLAWDGVFEIKDAFGNKQYKPEDIQELFRKLFNDVQNIHEELAEYINTLSWNHPAICYNDDDDDEDCTIAITPILSTVEPKDSLRIGDEHLDTIPEKEPDEFIKSSVENFVLNPSESKGEHVCDVHAYFSKKIYSNPLFDEEIISIKIDLHHFNAESDLIESMLNQDSSIISSSSKIDDLLDEFSGELILLISVPSRIDKAYYDPEEENRLDGRLLYDNSSPRPPEEFSSKNSDAIIESFSPSPILAEDSDPLIEEIDLFLASDGSIPSGMDNDYSDSEGDNLFLERLLHDDHILLPDTLDSQMSSEFFFPSSPIR